MTQRIEEALFTLHSLHEPSKKLGIKSLFECWHYLFLLVNDEGHTDPRQLHSPIGSLDICGSSCRDHPNVHCHLVLLSPR